MLVYCSDTLSQLFQWLRCSHQDGNVSSPRLPETCWLAAQPQGIKYTLHTSHRHLYQWLHLPLRWWNCCLTPAPALVRKCPCRWHRWTCNSTCGFCCHWFTDCTSLPSKICRLYIPFKELCDQLLYAFFYILVAANVSAELQKTILEMLRPRLAFGKLLLHLLSQCFFFLEFAIQLITGLLQQFIFFCQMF